MKKKLFVVSDIHGHYTELIESLNKAGFDEKNDNHLLVVCGDNFDRGRENVEVYKYLKRLDEENKAVILRGNHDTMFIYYLDGTVISPFNYRYNGTNETFADFLQETAPFESWCLLSEGIDNPTVRDFANWLHYARGTINTEYPELLQWLKDRPYYFETTKHIFTHASIDTQAEDWHIPQYRTWEELTWDDGAFFGRKINNTDKTVVIGHYSTRALRKMYNYDLENEDLDSILIRDDKRIIALDSCTILSHKINVLVLEEEI